MLRLTLLVVGILSFIDIPTAAAAESSDYVADMLYGVNLGNFTDNLTVIAQGLLQAGKVIAFIMTAVAGSMVVLGIEDGKKSTWNWILGIGLAINFADILNTVWGYYLQPIQLPPTTDFDFSLKDAVNPDSNFLGSFMMYLQRNIILPGAAAIAPIAMRIALVLTLIDATIKLAMDLVTGDKIKFLISTFLKTGFYLFLIQNWINGMGLMPSLGQGFEQMGLIAGGSDFVLDNDPTSTGLKPDSIVGNSLIIFNAIWAKVEFTNIPVAIISIICILTSVILLFLTAIEMFMARVEFYVIALVTLPLLAFGTIKQLNFLAEKAIGAMFNLSIKLFVISFLTVISNKIIYKLTVDVKEASASTGFWGNMSLMLQVVLVAAIMYFLVKKIPDLIQGLLSGNPSLGGGDMRKTAMDAANTAGGAAGFAAGAVSKGYKGSGMGAKMSEGLAKGGTAGMGMAAAKATPAMVRSIMGSAGKEALNNVSMYRSFVDAQKRAKADNNDNYGVSSSSSGSSTGGGNTGNSAGTGTAGSNASSSSSVKTSSSSMQEDKKPKPFVMKKK